MKISLSDHFTFRKLLRFTLPSVAMMIFISIYGVVDGFFVSNFVGKTPFAAVNFIMPFLMILGAIGFLFGTGGSALIAKTMGEGDTEHAQRLFSMFVAVSLLLGLVISVLGILFLRPIAAFLGAEGQLLDDCVLYGRVILLANPALILQFEFQSFFVTAEKPQLGLAVTVAAGAANMILDVVLVAGLSLGLPGAAAATAASQCIGGLVPLLYFSRPNTSRLRLTRASFDGPALCRACLNGSSELMTNISMSLVSMLYNVQLLRYAGEDGISAYGVLMYVNMIFLAVFLGYSVGSAPVVGYHYGAQNRDELKNLLKKSLILIGLFSVAMLGAAEYLAEPLARLFVGYDRALLDLTLRGFVIFSFSFLFAGISIYGSSFFTALNDGLTSAGIAFLRTLVFQIAAVIIFPLFWGIDGIWLSTVAAELLSACVTVFFLCRKRRQYGY